MNALYWRDPAWALLGLLPLLWLAVTQWRTHRLGRRYADPALWPWALHRTTGRGSLWRRACLLLAWLLFGLAAAGPRTPAWLPPDQDYSSGTLLVVLDLSRSMAAQDVWPSRRRLALHALQQLVPRLPGARTGLIVYAGRAHTLLPPSTDLEALSGVLRQLGDLRLPTLGSNLAGALDLARQALQDAAGQRHVLLLSDGDLDAAGREAAQAAVQALAGDGIGLTVAAVGTPGGAALPQPDGGWLQHAGETVLSRLDTATLSRLADGGGRMRVLDEQADTGPLLNVLPAGFARPQLGSRSAVLWHEHFLWLLLPAVLLWVAASLRLSIAAPAGLGMALVYLLGLALSLPAQANAYRDAYRALEGGDADTARALFDRQQGFAARMGSGASCYRLQDWACARQAFSEAVLAAGDDTARAGAIYNLAHVVFQVGDYAGAAALFGDALRYRPDCPAAAHNRDFATALAKEVARMNGEAAGGRPGRGSRMGEAADAPIPADARLGLAERTAVAPPGIDLTAQQRQALLNRGLQYIRLSRDDAGDRQAPWGAFQQRSDLPDDRDTLLWQRLMEQAEGFPASPEQPLAIPGVRPW